MLGVLPLQRLSLRRKMAEAAGKPLQLSFSPFLEMADLEIEADLACMAILFWAESVWMRRWDEDFEKCWRRQVWETDRWKHVRGSAGAVVCETRDLGIGFPRWHALLFKKVWFRT